MRSFDDNINDDLTRVKSWMGVTISFIVVDNLMEEANTISVSNLKSLLLPSFDKV